VANGGIYQNIMSIPCDWSLALEELCLHKLDSSWLGIGIEIILFLYMFLGLAVICDEYLVPSIETLCRKWKISEDLAGASFLALGSGAPEVIMSSIVTLRSATNKEIHMTQRLGLHRSSGLGVATILGSAWIAFLLIPACCTFFAGQDIFVGRHNLLRDIVFYILALFLLYDFGHDHVFTLEENICLVLAYVCYILAVIVQSIRAPGDVREMELEDTGKFTLEHSEPLAHYEESLSVESEDTTQASNQRTGLIDRVKRPMVYLFSVTAYRDVEENEPHEAYFFRTMMVSFLWVSIFSWIITVVISRWVTLSGMSSGFFGVILVSFGGQIPDAIQSVAAAKKGYGSMALSNALGSQNLNVLLGLGLPWLLCTVGDADGVAISHTYGLFVTGWMTFGIVIFFTLCTVGFSAVRNGISSTIIVITRNLGVTLFIFYALSLILFAAIMYYHFKSQSQV